MNKNSLKGISIVEIIIASAIIGISVVGITTAIQIYLKIVYQNTRETQAVLLLEEAAEALQYIRDVDYENEIEIRDPDIDYSLFWSGSGYELTDSSISLPYNMSRIIRFSDVFRDSADQITSDGGTLDLDTKKALITVEWKYSDIQKSISSEVLIHNIYAN